MAEGFILTGVKDGLLWAVQASTGQAVFWNQPTLAWRVPVRSQGAQMPGRNTPKQLRTKQAAKAKPHPKPAKKAAKKAGRGR